MIKLTIVIPNYNKSLYLEQMLDSVNNQLTEEVEVIFIDDCSTDNSVDIMLKHKISKNKNFHYVINKENLWVAECRNIGINNAKGEYITFMDSDDYVLDNYINTLLGYIEDGQYDLYGFDYIDDTGDDEYVERAGCAYVWSGLYRLSYLNKHNIRFDNLFSLYGFGEDAFFYDSFKATLPKCKYTKDKIYVYRWDTEGGISNEKNEGRRCITWYA